MTKEDVIRQYFCSWLKQDINLCKNLFAENAMYSECYGPIYRNKREILTWFRDWNKEGKVLEWP
ncbi:SnoaL-like polyketide cyclase, partial [Lactobacillus taiwanensis]